MLFCAAWEQLLKATIIEDTDEETISLQNSLEQVFVNDDKIKENILKIVDIRDRALHLLIPKLQGVASKVSIGSF